VSGFSRLSFRARLMIAASVPLSLFALSGAAILYMAFRMQFEEETRSRLETAATHLAHSCRLGLLAHAPSTLREPVATVLADPDVVFAGVYAADGSLIFGEGDTSAVERPERILPPGAGRILRAADGRLRELVRVVRHPRDEDPPELLGFLPELQTGEAALGEPEGFVRVVISTERQAAGYRHMLIESAVGMVLVLGVGAALAAGLSRRLVGSVEELAHAARRLAASAPGGEDERIDLRGSPELEALAHAFNEMSTEIRAYQRDMERRVELRTAQLDAARIEAERANEAKSQFLANMSHELRTPMTAILGFTDLLLDVPSLPEEAREQLSVVKRNSSHLMAVLNDVLDLSRIEAGRLEVEQVALSPGHLVAEVTSLWRVRAREKGLELSTGFETPIPSEVLSDPTRVRQALMNLVGNAIKFTERGEVRLDVAYRRDAECLEVRVSDTGIGVPPDKRSTLFQPFEQLDSSMSRRFGGSGLGLAITRRLALALGGDCTHAPRPGGGSVFSFCCRAPLREGAVPLELSADTVETRTEPGAAADEPALAARVLLAEDGSDNQRLISHMLTQAGAEVTVAENGREAVELASRLPFDVILMDMAMPEMDGYEATRVLREAGCELPIIALTAHAMSSDRQRCLDAGCSEYLTKPIQRSTLLATVRDMLSKRA